MTTHLTTFTEYLQIKGFSPGTRKSFTYAVKRFMLWCKKENITEPGQIRYNDIMGYVNYCKKQNNGQRTVQCTVNAIKHFYNHLQYIDVVTENPANNIIIKGVKRRILHDVLTNEELEQIYKSYQIENSTDPENGLPPSGERKGGQSVNRLARKRNKIILGLIIYQALRTDEIARLEKQDLQLREGKIIIQSGRKTNARTLKLESHQVYDLLEYINDTRKQILETRLKNTLHRNESENENENSLPLGESRRGVMNVFISIGASERINGAMQKLVKNLKKNNTKIKDLKQLRTSVIVNWLKIYNLRKVQYMCGHKYVSSTETYQLNNMEDLKDDIKKYHPII